MLGIQIDTRLHERQGQAVTNFAQALPPETSDLAQQILKDPYQFDFLNLDTPPNEVGRAAEAGASGGRLLADGFFRSPHRRQPILNRLRNFKFSRRAFPGAARRS